MITFTHDELRALHIGLVMHEGEGCIGFLSYPGADGKKMAAAHKTAKDKLEETLGLEKTEDD